RRITPKPNFLILLGERYGWQPLPEAIPIDEFHAILNALRVDADRETLESLYACDLNAIPIEWRLRPGRERNQSPTPLEAESAARALLREAVDRLSFDESQRLKYFSSAVAQEITAGALQVADAHDHVLCVFRKIKGAPNSSEANAYFDVTEHGRRD